MQAGVTLQNPVTLVHTTNRVCNITQGTFMGSLTRVEQPAKRFWRTRCNITGF
jgi:hypothetical protein